jgi:hypothetical protein
MSEALITLCVLCRKPETGIRETGDAWIAPPPVLSGMVPGKIALTEEGNTHRVCRYLLTLAS